MCTPSTVRRGVIINPPPTPSKPAKNPVAPPTTKLSVMLSRVMDVLTSGFADSRSNLHTSLGILVRIMHPECPREIRGLERMLAQPGRKTGALRGGRAPTCPLGRAG